MPPVAHRKGFVNIGTKKHPRWWFPKVAERPKPTSIMDDIHRLFPYDSTPAQPWTPGPVAQAAMNFAAEEPEMAVVALAFLVGLLCPCRERVCEKVIVACCDHRIMRAKKEKKT